MEAFRQGKRDVQRGVYNQSLSEVRDRMNCDPYD